jgi:hypothetical protein
MKLVRHSLLGLFLLTGACGGSIDDGSTEPTVPGSEESAGDGETRAQAYCEDQYSYGSCGSCRLSSAAPGEVSAMYVPGSLVRRRECCTYASGNTSCTSWSNAGCTSC